MKMYMVTISQNGLALRSALVRWLLRGGRCT